MSKNVRCPEDKKFAEPNSTLSYNLYDWVGCDRLCVYIHIQIIQVCELGRGRDTVNFTNFLKQRLFLGVDSPSHRQEMRHFICKPTFLYEFTEARHVSVSSVR